MIVASRFGTVYISTPHLGPQAGADGEEAADGENCDGVPAVGVRVGSGTSYRARCGRGAVVGAGGNRYTIQRSRRWMSRADVRWDPKFCSTAPVRVPRPSLHQISPVGWLLAQTRGERRCDGSGGAAEFFNRRGRSGADGEGAAVEQRCDGSPASGGRIGTPYHENSVVFQRSARVGIGTRYNARDAG